MTTTTGSSTTSSTRWRRGSTAAPGAPGFVRRPSQAGSGQDGGSGGGSGALLADVALDAHTLFTLSRVVIEGHLAEARVLRSLDLTPQ
jgi:hypothetical protein